MIDKTFDDLQEALSRVKVLENQLAQAVRDRDRYGEELLRIKELGNENTKREIAP